jgi:hypothetical protein
MSDTTTLLRHPIGPSAFDTLMETLTDIRYQLDDSERRGARIETRLVRLMANAGLDEQGNPVRKHIKLTVRPSVY